MEEWNWTLKTPIQKVTQSGFKDLNVRLKALKLLEENLERKFLHIGLGGDFLAMMPKAKIDE